MKHLTILTTLLIVVIASAMTANADPLRFVTFLSGPNESPPNASPGTGFATVIIDATAHTMSVNVTFSGLVAGVTASHIHAPTALPGVGTAGVATTTPTFTGFPSGVTSGTYFNVFDMTLASSYNPAFVTANGGSLSASEAALFSAITSGRAYLNIHTTTFTGGEIRGFLQPVPEPATMLLFGTGLASALFRIRRGKRRGA